MKNTAILLLLFMGTRAVSVFAGGNQDAEPAGNSQMPYAGTTIRIIAEQAAPTLALEKQIPEFEKITGIKVELESGPIDSVVNKQVLALESGNGAYDVISSPYQFLGQFVENDYLLPIDDFLNRSDLALEGFDYNDLIPGMVAASGEWKGTNYGLPSNSSIMMMIYRKDLFQDPGEQAAFKQKYGYDLEPPADWVKYRDIAEFFTRSAGETAGGEELENDLYGVTIAGKRHDAMTCEFLNYAWSSGGGVFDITGNLIVNSPQNVQALTYFNDLVQFSPPGVSQNTWDEVTTQMQQGIVAMMISWNDTAPAIEDAAASKVVGKVGYGAIPIDVNPAAHYGAWSYYIPKESPHPEAAWLFLQWVNTSETQKNIALNGGFPTLYSVYEDPELASSLPYWSASLAAYEISSLRPRIPEWNAMNNEMMREISLVLLGDKTAQRALDDLQTIYEDILGAELPVTYK